MEYEFDQKLSKFRLMEYPCSMGHPMGITIKNFFFRLIQVMRIRIREFRETL